jgi:hypothetical protein
MHGHNVDGQLMWQVRIGFEITAWCWRSPRKAFDDWIIAAAAGRIDLAMRRDGAKSARWPLTRTVAPSSAWSEMGRRIRRRQLLTNTDMESHHMDKCV